MTHDHPAGEPGPNQAPESAPESAAGQPAHDGRAGGPADEPRGLPGELADLLERIVPPDGGFRHRQHIHLAYLTVLRHGTAEAAVRIGQWIRHLAAYERAPQKYNATVTRAWTEMVGYHVTTNPAGGADSAGGGRADFEGFVARYPTLLDKRLLTQHYSPAVLASAAARAGWVDPDRVPFPWRPEAG